MKNVTARQIELSSVLRGIAQIPSTIVGDLRLDSRLVQPGDAFVAVSGTASHGIRHAATAVANGATVVFFDPTEVESADIPTVRNAIAIPQLKAKLGELADRAYGEPSGRLEVAAVTGTNGKTTCAWLYAICRDEHAAYLGTIGSGRPPNVTATTHTTADVFSLNKELAEFYESGSRHVGIEVSSHALDQNRVAGVRMPITAFTNLTRDHLDYHGSMAAYGAAKERLFSARGVCHAIINVDDSFGQELVGRMPASVEPTLVSLQGVNLPTQRYVVATQVDCLDTGLVLRGVSHEGEFALETRLVGRFNAENLLIVLGMLLASGLSLSEASERLATATAPPGRMEAFPSVLGPLVVVDYAHTPDALDKALSALSAHVRGDLYCVFGCGGDRDPGKRALMAKVAEAYAKYVVVTDDNPRTEDPDEIVSAIVAGFSGKSRVTIERDREVAIRSTVARARRGDIVLVAGKGHEDYQLIGAETRYFSDRAIASDLARRAA